MQLVRALVIPLLGIGLELLNVRKLDIISFLDAQVDPVQNELVDTQAFSIDHKEFGVCVELLLPDGAEGRQSGAGEGVHEWSERGLGVSSLPDGDQFVLAILVLLAEPIVVIANVLVRQRWPVADGTIKGRQLPKVCLFAMEGLTPQDPSGAGA